MFSRAALAFFALVVAEYYVFGFAAQLVGVSLVLWISLAAAALGIFVIRRSFVALLSGGGRPVPNGPTGLTVVSGTDVADRVLGIVAGALLVLPGLLTAAVGLALLTPPVRALFKDRIRHRAEGLINSGSGGPDGLHFSFANGGRFFGRRDIVDVDLHTEGTSPDDSVDDDGPTTAPPELH